MLVLNVQYWANDREQAMELVRLICDLEPTKRDDVHMLFTARFDCKHDEETIKYASNKFRTHKYTTTRKATGWPNGPNQMAAESYQHCVELYRHGRLPGVKGVFMIEADCVPLAKGWLDQIMMEYENCGKRVLGAWLKVGDSGVEHINGNCIISIDFWRICKAILHPDENGGWDATLAYALLPQGHASKLIWSDYRYGTSDNPWRDCDYLWSPRRYNDPENALYGQNLFPVYLHGLKTMDGLKCVRNALLNESESKASP